MTNSSDMEPQTPAPEPRAGASADDPAAAGYDLAGQPLYREPPPPGPGTLPMLVWLRGDEPYCGDFHLDADEVMARLGIKRSRLTQISGRELRVGRMRMGRYIRPVYREADVEAYRQWTRATASHVKAASVLQDAAKDLSSTTETLAADVRTTQQLQQETLNAVESTRDRLLAELAEHAAAADGRRATGERTLLYELLNQINSVRADAAGRVNALEVKLDALSPVVSLLPEVQKRTLQELAELQGLVRALTTGLLQLREATTQGFTALTPAPSRPRRRAIPRRRTVAPPAVPTQPAAPRPRRPARRRPPL
jgi:hypothetical protein